MFDNIARNKGGAQTPNNHAELDGLPETGWDLFTLMQDTAESQIPNLEQEAKNWGRPAPFYNLRWYEGDTTSIDPGIIASNASGWVKHLVDLFNLDYNRIILQVMNENNIQQEHPDDPGSWDNFDSYVRMANWEFACMNYIRQSDPQIHLGTLYLSPGHNEDQPGKVWDYKDRLDKPGQGVYTIKQGLYRLVKNELPPELAPERDEEEVCVAFDIPEIRRNVEYADVLGTHFYWDRNNDSSPIGLYDWDTNSNWMSRRFIGYHNFFPGKPIFISESNDNKGTNSDTTRSQFIQEMVWYINHLYKYPYVYGVTFFIWAANTSHPNIYSPETIEVMKQQSFPRITFGEITTEEPKPPIIPTPPIEIPVRQYTVTSRRLSPKENHGMHNIFIQVVDFNGKGKAGEVVVVGWPSPTPDKFTNLVTNSKGETDAVMYGTNPEGLEASPDGDYVIIFRGHFLKGYTLRRWDSDGEGNSYGHWSYEVIFKEGANVDYTGATPKFIIYNFDAMSSRPIDAIVIHRAQGTLAGMDAWFNNPDAGVSSHYGIGLDGTVHQYVDEKNNAWHAGAIELEDKKYWTDHPRTTTVDGIVVNWNNYRSIGIELEGYVGEAFPSEQMNSLINLTKYLVMKYNIVEQNIVAHSKLSTSRSDPGPTFDWSSFYRKVYEVNTVSEADILWAPYPFIPSFAIPFAWLDEKVQGRSLGRPTSPELEVNINGESLVVQIFEKGNIAYFKNTGKVQVVYAD